jgi:hypothetical protein
MRYEFRMHVISASKIKSVFPATLQPYHYTLITPLATNGQQASRLLPKFLLG